MLLGPEAGGPTRGRGPGARENPGTLLPGQLPRDSATRRIVGTQLHLDPITRYQPYKIPLHRTHYVGQYLLLILQLHHVHGTRPLFHHNCLDTLAPTRRTGGCPARPPAPAHGLVSTHGPFSVTAMQCSKCAE